MLNKCKLIVVFGLVAGLAACAQPVEPGGKYK